MIKMYAEIELLSGNNENYIGASCNIVGIEKSAKISDVIGKYVSKNKVVVVDKPENKLDYFHGSVYSNENCTFENNYVITFYTKEPIDTFFVSFDTYNKAYPREIEVKINYYGHKIPAGTYTDNDVQWEFNLPEKTQEVELTISNWSMPNKPLVITGIYSGLTLTLDFDKITDISLGIVTQADYTKPSYGIVSNSGHIEFNDYYNEIYDYIDLGLLKEGSVVRAYIENSLVPTAKRQVCEMYTDKWTYDTDNKSVSVTLVDGLERLQDIEFEGIPYYPRVSKPLQYADIYNKLKQATEEIGFTLDITGEVSAYLVGYKNPFPSLPNSSLWNALQKFGEATKTHIYKKFDGKLSFHF